MSQERIHRRRFLRVVGLTLAAAGSAAFLEACGGAKKTNPDTQVHTTTPKTSPNPEATTPAVTQAPQETPKPTEAPPFVPKKLSDAEFVPNTSFDTAVQSFDDAWADNPEASEIHPLGGDTGTTRDEMEPNVQACKSGSEVDRIGACSNLTIISYDIYRQTGYEDFYQSAVNWANYFLSELAQAKEKFDRQLEPWIHDTSPSLEK